ncbi:oligopeptidase A, partial [Providencia rettgeri]
MTNSLLADSALPRFSSIEPAHVFPAVEHVLTEYRQTVENLLNATTHYTWDNLCQPLEAASDKLSRVWSPVSHLHSVKNSPELREAYEQCLPLLSEFSTWMGQHEPLYQAYKSLKESAEFNSLSQSQRKSIENTLRDFELSGIGLPAEKQQRYGEIVARLSEIASKFGNNVLDATMGWTKLIKDEKELAGMPESAIAAAKAMAEA